MGEQIKPLDFKEVTRSPPPPKRMSRRAWYVVFGAARLEKDDCILSKDLAQRIHTLYNDVDPEDISEIIENYLEQRRQMNV